MKKFKIGDIVFVSNYQYKNGDNGQKHSFIIIDDGQAVDIDYFGFLLSSKLYKERYPYNHKIRKNKMNRLKRDSIVKCDDLIKINEHEIEFKIGEVSINDLEKFVNSFEKYLENQ